MTGVAELCAFALQCHQAGQLGQAEQLYRQILQADPLHADAHHLLGVLAMQSGKNESAVASIRQAVSLNPHAAPYYSNLGLALDSLGRPEEAAASYRHALALDPNMAQAHSNLANTLQTLGRPQDALGHYQSALQLRPGFAQAHNGMGNLLQSQGRFQDAVTHFKQALESNPAYPEVHNNLGNALHHLGELAQAAAHFREAVRLEPNFVEAYCNLGNSLKDQRQLEEAITFYEHALRLRPTYLEGWNNLGNALLDQGNYEKAADCYRNALGVSPGSPEVQYNLGNALLAQGSLDEAVACYEQALRTRPDLSEANHNLGRALLDQGQATEAAARFRQTLRSRPHLDAAHNNLLLARNYDPDVDLDELFAEHCRWGEMRSQAALSEARRTNYVLAAEVKDPRPERRLRIGYVSPDLRRHALTRYIEPIISHHDPEEFEVFCYGELVHTDEVTTRLQGFTRGWRWTRGMSDVQLAKQIQNDGIDILVDLAGHTANNRLGVFALKPAPVQITWLGYLNTTGLSAVDYRLTDEVLDPPGEPRRDVEQLFRLPSGFCCFAPVPQSPVIVPLPALSRGYITFGSPHNLFKLNHRVYDLWSQVLHALPTARLLMFRETLKGTALEAVLRQFSQRGIEPHRLDLRQTTSGTGYLRLYDEIDIGLDAFPWSGGVTTCESLWMGVPVLTLNGVRPAARNTAAVLSCVGLQGWVADSEEDFVSAALGWVSRLDELAALRAQMRERMNATICDAVRFTRQLEQAYRTMWKCRCGVP